MKNNYLDSLRSYFSLSNEEEKNIINIVNSHFQEEKLKNYIFVASVEIAYLNMSGTRTFGEVCSIYDSAVMNNDKLNVFDKKFSLDIVNAISGRNKKLVEAYDLNVNSLVEEKTNYNNLLLGKINSYKGLHLM